MTAPLQPASEVATGVCARPPLAFARMSTREFYEALWEGVPEGLQPAGFEHRRRFLLDRVKAGDRVLDVGCGEGAFTSELARAGAQVVGLDVAEEPLRRARARQRSLDLRLVEPAGGWALPDASFDVVWAGEVIEHVAGTAAWMSELRRVLRSGGLLLMSTPAHDRGARLLLALSERSFALHFDPRSDHLRFYSRRTLTALLCDFGFESVSVVPTRAGGSGPSGRLLLAEAVRSRF
jgi:2-polyprenyl-3-methyl-5-hydroxy-6-metoxy-1,4-benzoquinol methylase